MWQYLFFKQWELLILPHAYVENCVVYTGTRDNNTARVRDRLLELTETY